MPINSASFVRATILLLIVGFVSVFAIVAAAVWLAARNDIHADNLIDALDARRIAFRALNLLLDAETGQRGYLLTHEEAYLAPYTEALANLETELGRLRDLAKTQPRYAAGIEDLIDHVAVKRRELDDTVGLMQAGNPDAALTLVRTDRGRVAMEEVRNSAQRLITATEGQVRLNTNSLRASAGQLLWALAAGGFVILGIVGSVSWLAWRYTRDLEMARSEVMALNATLEVRVRERTADVIRANEEIQRFAYIVSHDLRSPLVNIMGFTTELQSGLASLRALVDRADLPPDDPLLVEARAALESEMPEALDFIRSSTTKMDRLINAILKLSREGQRKLRPERIRMADVFEAAGGSIRHQLDQAKAELIIVEPIPDIVTDRLSVEQIFGNILDNAVKYLDPERPGRVTVRARESALGVEYEVEDNGRGIAAADQDRIFDLFRRAGAQDRPGEGIGLSHVRALVRLLGGTISLSSEPGVGTSIRVRLPRILTPLTESEAT
jgi:signal transduction histidine kinase